MLFFSKLIVNISVKIISFMKKIIMFCFKTILYPINILYKCMNAILIKPIIKIFTKFYFSLAKIAKKPYNTKYKDKKQEILKN